MPKSPYCQKCHCLICNGICACNRTIRPKRQTSNLKVHFGIIHPYCEFGGKEPKLTTNWKDVTCLKCLQFK